MKEQQKQNNSYILQLTDDEIKELMSLLITDFQLTGDTTSKNVKRRYDITRKDNEIIVELRSGVFYYCCTLHDFNVENDSLCSLKRRENTKNIFVKYMLSKFGKQYGEDYVENRMFVAKDEITEAWKSLNKFDMIIKGLPESEFTKSSSKAFQLVSDIFDSAISHPDEILRQQLTDYVQNLLDELGVGDNL